MRQTMKDWSRTFRLAKTTLETESFATKDILAARNLAMKSSRAYKTPRKESQADGLDMRHLKQYKSFVHVPDEDPQLQAEKFMAHIEKSFLTM